MERHKGSYAILQYSPAPERLEFVNVGVVLVVPSLKYAAVRFSASPRRVEKLFGRQSKTYFDSLVKSFQERFLFEARLGWQIEHIERFAKLRANELRVTKFQSISVEHPDAELNMLFDELVGYDKVSSLRRPKIQSALKRRFVDAGVDQLLEAPEPVSLPQGITISTHFAYQNGAYNMIDSMRLGDDPGHALEEAGKRAIEGQWLHEYSNKTKRLVVVGDFTNQEDLFSDLDAAMKRSNVKLYRFDDLTPLIDDIRRSFVVHN